MEICHQPGQRISQTPSFFIISIWIGWYLFYLSPTLTHFTNSQTSGLRVEMRRLQTRQWKRGSRRSAVCHWAGTKWFCGWGIWIWILTPNKGRLRCCDFPWPWSWGWVDFFSCLIGCLNWYRWKRFFLSSKNFLIFNNLIS